MIRLILINILIIWGIGGCSKQDHHSSQLKSQLIEKDGLEILHGEVSAKQIFFDFPEWKLEYDEFAPDTTALDSFYLIKNKYQVEIYMGTWCSDSEREVPRFIKIVESSSLKNKLEYKIFGVDRSKSLPGKSIEDKNIERVATFIVFKDGKEIGRIVETPKKSLEKDLLKILLKE
jgi:thiol-disulfide isomerase/thioredoxin